LIEDSIHLYRTSPRCQTKQDSESEDELEGRSIHAEIDYTNPKIASRIIQKNNLNNMKRHHRVLTVSNLENMDDKRS